MHPRASHTSTNRPSRDSAPISTAVRRREARTYADLAAAAREAGFDVSPSQVQEWVMAGLLPRTGEQVSVGRHGFTTERQPGVAEQLLALCRLRQRTKSWGKLAVLLWAEGWLVNVERVRAAVLAWFPTTPLPTHPTEKQLDQWAALANRLAPKFGAVLGLGRIGPDVSDGLYQGVLVSAGLGSSYLDEEGAVAIEVAAGMAPRARTDRWNGLGPWLTGSALTGLDVLGRSYSIERLRSLTESASDAELQRARPLVRFFVLDFPDMVRVIELFKGRNFLGVGAIPRLAQSAPEIGLPLALFFAAEGLAEPMDALVQALRSTAMPVQATLDSAERYLAQHPEHRRAARRIGLLGLAEQGTILLGIDAPAFVDTVSSG